MNLTIGALTVTIDYRAFAGSRSYRWQLTATCVNCTMTTRKQFTDAIFAGLGLDDDIKDDLYCGIKMYDPA